MKYSSYLKAAQWFLLNRKVRILTKNYTCKQREIDIIAEEERDFFSTPYIELVFIEVKSTSSETWVPIEYRINPKKCYRIQTTANHFLKSYAGKAKTLRFDLLIWNGKD